jgi:hypothetical protein
VGVDMKTAPVVFAFVFLGLCMDAYAQGKPGGGGPKPSRGSRPGTGAPSQPPRMEPSRPSSQSSRPHYENRHLANFAEGIGICLMGEEYVYTDDAEDADKCDAFIWVSAITWLINQRILLNQTALANEEEESDGATVCRSCTGTCQTVALPIKDTTYEDVEADSGLSPTECLGNIKLICESGSYRHFATARCGN